MTIQQIQKIISDKIPPGLIIPEHTEDEHFYRNTKTNKLVKSSTGQISLIQGGNLKFWVAKQTVEYIEKNWDIITNDNRGQIFKAAVLAHHNNFQEAGIIGNEVHSVIDRYLKKWIKEGQRPKDIKNFILGEDSRLFAATRSAQEFCIDYKLEPISSELIIMSDKFNYGGTLDALCFITIPSTGKRIFVLLDWKTSNSVKKNDYAMQTSSYWYGVNEMTGLSPQEIVLVQLDKKTAKYSVVRVLNKRSAFAAFKNQGKSTKWFTDGKEKLEKLNKKKIIKI